VPPDRSFLRLDPADTCIPEALPSVWEIRHALGSLPSAERRALLLRELEGCTYAEIGERLRVDSRSAELLLIRARIALCDQFDGELTCGEAERALSLERDGRLSTTEAAALRGHLRSCSACVRVARRQRQVLHALVAALGPA
jgi:hypothetical protein